MGNNTVTVEGENFNWNVIRNVNINQQCQLIMKGKK